MTKRTPSQLGRASRESGKRGERQVVSLLKGNGFYDAHRTAQHMGMNQGEPDVKCPTTLPHIHFEVKHTRSIGLGSKELTRAIEQATRDCGSGRTLPVVFWKRVASHSGWNITLFGDAIGLGHVQVTFDRECDLQTLFKRLSDLVSESSAALPPTHPEQSPDSAQTYPVFHSDNLRG